MTNLWTDANILLRLITGDPADLAERSLRFVQQADAGEVTIRLLPVGVAEMVWVLRSFYRFPQEQISTTLLALITANGVQVEDRDNVSDALARMSSANVDFIDAYVAAVARSRGEAVASFDRDFRRLEVAWIKPSCSSRHQ